AAAAVLDCVALSRPGLRVDRFAATEPHIVVLVRRLGGIRHRTALPSIAFCLSRWRDYMVVWTLPVSRSVRSSGIRRSRGSRGGADCALGAAAGDEAPKRAAHCIGCGSRGADSIVAQRGGVAA